jgi:hypothetical protein
MDALRLEYATTKSGRTMVHKLVGGRGKNPGMVGDTMVRVPVATPFGVPARLRHVGQDDAYGLRVVVENMASAPRAIDFSRAELARMNGAEIRARLFEAGLRTEADGEMVAVQALKAASPQAEILILPRPGWHHLDGVDDPLFLAPAGEAVGAPKGISVELQASARLPAYGVRAGSLAGWQAAIGAALAAPSCPHWALGIISGLAGPVLDLVGLDSCGISLSGPSSRGKSTAQRLAASAWSSPKLGGGGLFCSLRVSENAVEAWVEQASGTVLPLDELAHSDGRMIARLIYAIAGGVGKGRMRADTTLRPSHRWSTFAMLSAEHSLKQTVQQAGAAWQAGMAVRIADIDVTSVNANVDAGTLAAIEGIAHHFGHTGDAFVRALVAEGVHRE